MNENIEVAMDAMSAAFSVRMEVTELSTWKNNNCIKFKYCASLEIYGR